MGKCKPKLSTRLRGLMDEIRVLERQANPNLELDLQIAKCREKEAISIAGRARASVSWDLAAQHERDLSEYNRLAAEKDSHYDRLRKFTDWIIWMALDVDPANIESMSQEDVTKAFLEVFPREPGGMGKRIRHG